MGLGGSFPVGKGGRCRRLPAGPMPLRAEETNRQGRSALEREIGEDFAKDAGELEAVSENPCSPLRKVMAGCRANGTHAEDDDVK